MTAPTAACRPPTVSVVIATRDRPAELCEALASVREQRYDGRIETVVVYDRSEPDPALDCADADRPVRTTVNARSPGLAGARNTGLLAATGELVAFCDDDDVWLPGKVAAQAAVFAADPFVELVACGIRVRYAGHVTERMVEGTIVTFADLLASRLTELHPSTFCLRRSAVLDGFGLIEEELPGSYAEDYELLLRAARSRPLHTVPQVLVEVRWHPRSYFEGRWVTISSALRWLLERYPEFGEAPAGYARVAGQIAFADAARGERRAALGWAVRAARHNPAEARAYLAALVAAGIVRPETVLSRLHARGKGL